MHLFPQGESWPIIEPDFDDDLADRICFQHDIESTGVIELHPDGYRHDLDRVPLHTRCYNTGTLAELKIREWKQHLEDLKRWRQEADERDAKVREQGYGIELRTIEAPQPRDPMERLLINMKLDKPIAAGQGRVWEGYVMINETDAAKWGEDKRRAMLAEVWRGQGLVIFRLR